MRIVVALACALGGCGGGNGALLLVTAPASATSATVWLAPAACQPSNGIACASGIVWPGATTMNGAIFEFGDTAPITVPVHSGRAELRLEAAEAKLSVERIVIVAFDHAGSPVGVGVLKAATIPAHSSEQWLVTLVPTSDPSAPQPGTDQLHLWSSPDNSETCIAWAPAATSQASFEFYTPATDHDCDGWVLGTHEECDDYWYNAMTPADGACLAMGPAQPAGCTLGAGACKDGTGVLCAQTQPVTCLPDELCARCPDTNDPASCLLSELAAARAGTSAMFYEDCTHFVVGVGGPCLTEPPSSISTPACTAVAIYDPALPLGTPLVTNNGSFAVNTATFALKTMLGAPCTINLSYVSGVLASNVSGVPFLVDVTTPAGTHAIVALVIGAGGTCTGVLPPSACMPHGGLSVSYAGCFG